MASLSHCVLAKHTLDMDWDFLGEGRLSLDAELGVLGM